MPARPPTPPARPGRTSRRSDRTALNPVPTGETARRWIDAEHVALRVGVSVRTVRTWTAAGLIPHVRLPGRLVRYDGAAVDAWVASHTVGGGR